MNSYEISSNTPLVADGGVQVPMDKPDDPYRALDDLMVVVEALCPEWPQRDLFKNESRNLL